MDELVSRDRVRGSVFLPVLGLLVSRATHLAPQPPRPLEHLPLPASSVASRCNAQAEIRGLLVEQLGGVGTARRRSPPSAGTRMVTPPPQLQGIPLERAGVGPPRVGEGHLDLADGTATLESLNATPSGAGMSTTFQARHMLRRMNLRSYALAPMRRDKAKQGVLKPHQKAYVAMICGCSMAGFWAWLNGQRPDRHTSPKREPRVRRTLACGFGLV